MSLVGSFLRSFAKNDLREVASTLNLSIHTVRSHVKAIFAKTNVSSRAELTAVFG